MTEGRARYKTVEMTIGEFLKKAKLSKNQGDLDTNRVKSYKARVHEYLNSPTNPITWTSSFVVIQGNHRTQAAILINEEGLLNKNHVIRVNQLSADHTPHEVATTQIAANNANATNKAMEQTALNKDIPISQKIFLPLHSSVKNELIFMKPKPMLTLITKFGAILNQFPTVVGSMSSEKRIAIPGTLFYKAKSFDEAKTIPMMSVVANCDLRNQATALSVFKTALLKTDRCLNFFNDKETQLGGKLADLIGQNRTTFLYILFSAYLSGRADETSQKAMYAKMSKNRAKIKNRLQRFANDPEGVEQSVCDLAGLGSVSAHEALESKEA